MIGQQGEECARLERVWPAIYLKGSLPGGDQEKQGADEGISARCIGREEAKERLRLTGEENGWNHAIYNKV